jgi:hypothetical protein
MFGFVLVEPDETAGIDHLGGQQAGPAEFTHDLPKGVVGEPRHPRLQDGRVDLELADVERFGDRLSLVNEAGRFG